MTGHEHSRPIEVIDAIELDERDGPAVLISPRRAAWIVDAAVLLAVASGPHAACGGDVPVRRSPDARAQP